MAGERSEETMKEVHRVLEGFLHGRGLRVTPERTAIVDAIYGMESPHFTIEQLSERLKEHRFHVALATLYNNMDMLLAAGLIWRHYFGGTTMYEACYGITPHYHCICMDCGQITNMTNDRLTSRLEETRIRGFKADFAYIYLYGLCTKCAAARRRRNNKKKNNK